MQIIMEWYKVEKKDLPKANLFFLKKIKEELNKKCWNYNKSCGEYVYITTQEFSYCYDVMKYIQKRLSNKTWECKMIYYCKGDKGFFNYTFQMKKR